MVKTVVSWKGGRTIVLQPSSKRPRQHRLIHLLRPLPGLHRSLLDGIGLREEGLDFIHNASLFSKWGKWHIEHCEQVGVESGAGCAY